MDNPEKLAILGTQKHMTITYTKKTYIIMSSVINDLIPYVEVKNRYLN